MSAIKHIVCPHCNSINRVPESRITEGPLCGECRSPLLNATPIDLDQSNFSQHIEHNDLPVVVDFWAPWCGPCKSMAPVYAQAAKQFGSRMRFAKVNTQDHPGLAGRYGIRGVPTMILFRQGREVDRVTGAMQAQQLSAWVQQHIDR